jgi:tRNA(Ile)-lysidine synthase TilS/MesJ
MTHGLNYSQWKTEHRSILENFPGKEMFLLFSAGKDSSLAMDFLLRAGDEFGFSFEAHAGAFPVHRYDQEERRRISVYWQKRGINPVWHKPTETDTIFETAENPCFACQSIRKRMLMPFLAEQVKNWHNLVIVTSYSLWDLVSYSVEQMLMSLLRDPREEVKAGNKQRIMETAQRFQPVLKMKEGYIVFRPLIKYNGRDIQNLVEKNNIPTLRTPCKFKDQRPKRLLEKYYDKLEMGFDYEKLLKYADKALNFPDASTWTAMDRDEYLGKYF